MNPIEKIWGIMKWKVEKSNPKNLKELSTMVQQAWDDITIEEIRNTIDNFSKVINYVIENEGKFCKF